MKTSLNHLCIAVLLVCGCQRGPEIVTGTKTDERVEAAPVNGESYRTRNGQSAITLISSSELEYRVDSGTTLLCKYSDQGNALRIIMTALGTQQVLYFRRVPNGLMSNDGEVYLNSAGLAEVARQEQIARQQQLESEAAARAARAENERQQAIAAAHEAEQQRIATERAAQEAAARNAKAAHVVVGTWRDENTTTTYFPDGSYLTQGEQGFTAKARWSVDDGYLLLHYSEWKGKPNDTTVKVRIVELTPSAMTLVDSGGTWHNVRVK